MTDAITLLNKDHREVERLFAQFESDESFETALKICNELTVHAEVEEEIVYPVLENVDPKLENEAEKEHQEAKDLIARIEGMSNGDPELVPTVTKLKEAIQHHVEEEETQAWPEMREQAGSRLDELGAQIEARTKTLRAEMQGGTTAPTGNLLDLTKEELYTMAKEQDLEGRSKMTKDQLARALSNR